MVRIPIYKFKLTHDQKSQYNQLKSTRKKIIKKYRSFSPDNPVSSPLPELCALYSDMSATNPVVLFYFAVKQYRDITFNTVAGNICIGLVSGIVASFISSDGIPFVQEALALHPIVKLIYLSLFIVVLFGVSYFCVWAAHFILPLFLHDLEDVELEFISELLGLEQYFSIQAQDPASTPEETEPTASPEDPESTEPAPVPEETESTAPPEASKSPDPTGTSRPC